RADRGPIPGDAGHRVIADWIYDLPRLSNVSPFLRHAFGEWQVSGIFSVRSGERVIVTESCASPWHCRPDYVSGPTVHENWKENATSRCTPGARCTVQYLNKSAFALVPVDPRSRVTVRPGTVGVGRSAVLPPGGWMSRLPGTSKLARG